ncbi:MAG: hypothetical protein JGK17_32005 [Microcoleus sp. PH2017_10_PVI_O_A]|uniref:hypothetical protein n=1 Tax=unclassified Microcoleus TaxID=2642155 RepID=UPI001DF333C5|nr:MULTISPECIES: hypothetical protein [unclassified Microcoleus]MCC3410077.1 hypothetical protein [Microcoleus sp. PH2017_10_PVI_O_A]MCC3482681.1 hypothetical protein [Microcoleus sp. PH2017_12_PCY_D_A]
MGIQLIDYGNGLLKQSDFIEIEFAVTIDISKKNNDFQELSARIASLESLLDLFGAATPTASGTNGLVKGADIGQQQWLLRGDRTWQNPQTLGFASISNTYGLQPRSNTAGAINANEQVYSSYAGMRWIDGGATNLNLPNNTGMLQQFDTLFGTSIANKYRVQEFAFNNRWWKRSEINNIWTNWLEIAFLNSGSSQLFTGPLVLSNPSLRLTALPTSPTGLSSGSLWRNGTTIDIVV